MEEAQLPFELKVTFTHLLRQKTQNGMEETQLPVRTQSDPHT